MANLPSHVVAFAGNNTKTYEQFKDYYFHARSIDGKNLGDFDKTIAFAEKETRMHTALLSEVTRLSGQSIPEGMDMVQFASNPMLKWAMGAVVNTMIDAIIPDTIIKSIGLYTNIQTVGWGASARYDIKPNAIMSTTKFSNGRRDGWAQKQFNTSVSITPEAHNVTVEASLYKILVGEESLAEFARKAILALETEMTKDAYATFAAIADRVGYPVALNSATFSSDSLIEQCQIVESYALSKPVIIGTKRALAKVLPESSKGYRMTTTAEAPGIGLIRNFYEYDIMELPQVATGKDFGLALSDDYVYIIAPSSDKLVKGAIEGVTQSFTVNPEDTADLTTSTSFTKRWKFEIATNSVMARTQVSS